jgi:SnoaL-like domain
MSAVEALMRANLLEVFGERDADRRAEAIARTYAEDVTFADGEATTTGREALEQRVVALQSRLPADASFAPFGPLYAGGDQAALAWTLSPAGGEPIARGLDIATIADGRIVALRTLLTG